MAPAGPHCPQEMSPGPTSCVLWQSYTEWLQELREKGPELLKPPPASTEPSSVSMGANTHPCRAAVVTSAVPCRWEGRVPGAASSGSWAKPLCLASQTPVLPSGPGLQAERGRGDPEQSAG